MTPWPSLLLVAVLALPLFGCGVRCDVPRCDIRSHGCQEQVRDATVCIRGGARPEVDLVIVDDEQYLRRRLDEARSRSDEEQVDAHLFYRGLALFGLLGEGLQLVDGTEADASRTAAFYDPETREVAILDSFATEGAAPLLVHELVHAMQDAEHGLDTLEVDGPDARQALGAMIEGEASLYGAHALAYQTGFELDEVQWDTYFAERRRASEESVIDEPDAYFALYSAFAYPFGVTYAHQAFERGGRGAVAELLDDPPVSARQVMTGYAGDPPGGGAWLDPELEDVAVPQLPEGFRFVRTTGLGAFGLRVLAGRTRPRAATDFTQLLQGDRLSVFVAEDGETVVSAYRMLFATHAAALGAQAAVAPAARAEAQVLLTGRTLMVVAHEGPTAIPQLRNLTWGPEPERVQAEIIDSEILR